MNGLLCSRTAGQGALFCTWDLHRVLVCAFVCECVCLFWPSIRWEGACSVAGLLKNCKQVTQCSDPLQDRLCWRRSPPCPLSGPLVATEHLGLDGPLPPPSPWDGTVPDLEELGPRRRHAMGQSPRARDERGAIKAPWENGFRCQQATGIHDLNIRGLYKALNYLY